MTKRVLGDINLSDEYLSIGLDDSLEEAGHRFMSVESGVLIVLNDDDKARGVITQNMIIRAVLDGKKLANTKCKSIMQSDILEFNINTPIPEVMSEVEKREPKAIIGVDDDGAFMGWFSPIDYVTALGYQ